MVQDEGGSLSLAGQWGEVQIVGELLIVEGFLVVLHDVGEVGRPGYFREDALLLGLLEVVLGSVVFMLGEGLFLAGLVLGLLALLLALGLVLLHREEGRPEFFVHPS